MTHFNPNEDIGPSSCPAGIAPLAGLFDKVTVDGSALDASS